MKSKPFNILRGKRNMYLKNQHLNISFWNQQVPRLDSWWSDTSVWKGERISRAWVGFLSPHLGCQSWWGLPEPGRQQVTDVEALKGTGRRTVCFMALTVIFPTREKCYLQSSELKIKADFMNVLCILRYLEIISLEKLELSKDICLAVSWGKTELLLILR